MNGCRNYLCSEIRLFFWYGSANDQKELFNLSTMISKIIRGKMGVKQVAPIICPKCGTIIIDIKCMKCGFTTLE